MSQTVTKESAQAPAGDWETSRRDKLQKIAALGLDPWGSRFDDHTPIGKIRARAGEITFHRADGQPVTLPKLETPEEQANFRQWLADQGQGEMTGPRVRAAGRI